MGIYYNKKTFISFFISCFLFATPVFASEVFFESISTEFAQGENFLVDVFVDTRGASLNAVSGQVFFETDLLEIQEIRDGNSIINFWVDKPIEQEGVVTFSGITPGGFSGHKNFLFSVVFQTKKSGVGSIKFGEVVGLLNDGNGSKIIIKKSPLNFSVSNLAATSFVSKIEDGEPPEDFKPVIGNDPEIFGGKYFLVFTTQDKGVGIDHYEVREGFWGKYEEVESPYLLQDQSLNKKVYVRAVDKSLNERVVVFESENHKSWYLNFVLLSIILLSFVIVIFLIKKIWSKIIR